MFTSHKMVEGLADDSESLDMDIPDSHRRISFVSAKNSQELIPTHLDRTLESRLRHAIGTIFFGSVHVRVAFSLMVACGLCIINRHYCYPEQGQDWLDLGVYCLAYGFWFVFCVPMLLAHLNVRLVMQVVHGLFRVFFAEMAVLAYAYYRGHNNVLRRGFSLFPTLEANRPGTGLAWLGEAGYNLRLASLISCVIIACIVTGMEIWANRSLDML